jgi:VanZ family protein
MRKFARSLSWLLLVALVFVTVCPINLRPLSGEPIWFERWAAFAVFAFVFSIGYPRQRLLVLALTVAAAGALEAAQMLQATRHTRLSDFYVKAAGCVFGWLLAYVTVRLSNARQQSRIERCRA